IEAEKDTTQHLDVEHSINEQQSSPPAESQAEHIMNTDEFINESSAGYARTPRTGDSQEQDGTVVSKLFPTICLPSQVLQTMKDLAPE
ncbi:hypothetical protein A2U01_0083035, partial [Trifolium medium]|nr:hypothetical protein [Trifolium medium]